jgi:hypothetical protein
MKKVLLLFLALAFSGLARSQELGIRFGDIVGGNVAVDGVFALGQFSRVHADVSFGKGLGVEALWDVIYRPVGPEGLDWYLGVGAYMYIHDPFSLGVPGEIGLAYTLSNAPVSFSIDWRPTLRLIDDTDFFADRWGLNIRYVFGSTK